LPGGKWKRKTEDRGAIRGGLRGLDKAKRLGEKQARVAAPNQPDQVKLLSTEKEELTLPGGRLTKKKKGGNASSAGIRGQDLPLNRTEPTTAQLGATGSWEIGKLGVRSRDPGQLSTVRMLWKHYWQLPTRPMQFKSAASGAFPQRWNDSSLAMIPSRMQLTLH